MKQAKKQEELLNKIKEIIIYNKDNNKKEGTKNERKKILRSN